MYYPSPKSADNRLPQNRPLTSSEPSPDIQNTTDIPYQTRSVNILKHATCNQIKKGTHREPPYFY